MLKKFLISQIKTQTKNFLNLCIIFSIFQLNKLKFNYKKSSREVYLMLSILVAICYIPIKIKLFLNLIYQ